MGTLPQINCNQITWNLWEHNPTTNHKYNLTQFKMIICYPTEVVILYVICYKCWQDEEKGWVMKISPIIVILLKILSLVPSVSTGLEQDIRRQIEIYNGKYYFKHTTIRRKLWALRYLVLNKLQNSPGLVWYLIN